MKYWGYLAAKLAVAAGAMYLVWLALVEFVPVSETERYYRDVYGKGSFGHDLAWTFIVLAFWLVSAGLLFLIVWDQKRRCHTCLRRLRMPVEAGSWPNPLLIGPPRMDYICPYGHGTLRVPEVQVPDLQDRAWQPHGDDIWKELASLDEPRK